MGVATVVDSEIMPPGTMMVSPEVVEALNICTTAATDDVPVPVGVTAGDGDAVTVGVAVGELVGVADAVTVGVGVVDVDLLMATLVISSLSSFVRSFKVNSNSASPSMIRNVSEYVFELSLTFVSITRVQFWLISLLSG